MGKLNLSEAAKQILTGSLSEGAKEELAKTTGKKGETFGLGKKIAADEQGIVDLGPEPTKTTDSNFDATKGVPTAKAPGATPPVGSEKASKLAPQPAETMGRKDLVNSSESDQEDEQSNEALRDRVAAKKAKQTMSANKGAVCCAEGEEDEEWENEEEEEEELEEASVEEVMEDLEELSEEDFEDKYGMSKEDAATQIDENVEELDEVSKMALDKFKNNVASSSKDHIPVLSKNSKGMSKKALDRKWVADEYHPANKSMNKEDMDALFSGESLSEDFKVKASAIFETAVETRVEEISAELQESYLREFEEAVESVKEDFAEKLDSYLDYVVENWMEENKLAIEKGLRTEIAEDFINSLKNVFVEHYIDIPQEKADLVEELVAKVDELEESVNSQIEKNISLKKTLAEHKKIEAIHSVCEGLTMSQVEKIKSLAKNVEFSTEEDFTDKLETLKESYFPSNIRPATQESLDEPMLNEDENVSTKYVDPFVEQVAKTISKTLTK